MPVQSPILSVRDQAPSLDLGSSTLRHHVPSDQTQEAFSVVEFVSEPGQGVGLHTHQYEEELVYLLEGEIEVTLGDQTLQASAGTCAVLPRNIPHGYQNVGKQTSRLLAVLLPGRLDQFFVKLDQTLASPGDHAQAIDQLCQQFGLTFHDEASS